MITALQCINSLKPYTLAAFKPGIFCSIGGRDDPYATPPGPQIRLFQSSTVRLTTLFLAYKRIVVYKTTRTLIMHVYE
jgi:hypothetical protein